MVAYRFCRPDDMPLICEAVNACFNVHFPGTPTLDVEGLRKEVKELDVWISNAMVARQGDDPIGVLMATKRPDEVLIHRVGLRPDYQRQGHGGHMLMSLSHKLAVLGPPRLTAEVPEDVDGLLPFFHSAGYQDEATLQDYVRPRPEAPEPVPEELFLPTTVDELEEQDLLEAPATRPWVRSMPTLLNRRDVFQGWALAGPERTEAFLLARPADPPEAFLDVVAWGARDDDRRAFFLDLLVRRLEQGLPAEEQIEAFATLPVRLPRLTPEEIKRDEAFLKGSGFEPGRRYRCVASEAVPA